MKNETKKYLIVCYAGNVMTIISTHDTKEEAYKAYNAKISMSKPTFINGLGYVKLFRNN